MDDVRKYVIAAALVAAISTPAFAEFFYVVRDISTKACRLSHIPPDPKTTKLVGVTAYMTKAEAKAAERNAVECKTANSTKVP